MLREVQWADGLINDTDILGSVELKNITFVDKFGGTKVGDLILVRLRNAVWKVIPGRLGNFVRKIGDYRVFDGGEVFYRGMSRVDYDILKTTGKLPATSETFTSPSLEYIKAVGYGSEGVIVRFQMKHGMLSKLESIGVRNDDTRLLLQYYPNMLEASSGWTLTNALFKTEGKKYGLEQINIGLGKGPALSEFNKNIVDFQIVK